MRFLRIKPRRAIAEPGKVGVSAEEEEEGRRSLLIPRTGCDPLGDVGERAKIELPDLSVLHLPPDPPCRPSQEQAVSATQVITLKAFIHCQGCARRAKKTLSKLQGVSTFHVDMDKQKVTVVGSMSADEVLQNMNKILKGAELWPSAVSTHEGNRLSSLN